MDEIKLMDDVLEAPNRRPIKNYPEKTPVQIYEGKSISRLASSIQLGESLGDESEFAREMDES